MKQLFTLLLSATCFTASAQVEFPWNPDSNGDGEIGVDDLLGMLASFGEPWGLPDPNEWASQTLQGLIEWDEELDSLQSELTQQEALLDSLLAEQLCVNQIATDVCEIGGGGNYTYQEYHYYLGGHNCRTVLYNKNAEQSRDLVMHLPVNDNCDGDEVHFIGTSTSTYQGQPIRIEFWNGNEWAVLASLPYNGDQWGVGEQYGRLAFVKARYEDGQWYWVQNASFDVPFNQPEE